MNSNLTAADSENHSAIAEIRKRIYQTSETCRFHLYLNFVNKELYNLRDILSKSVSERNLDYYQSRVLDLFNELFRENIGYFDDEKEKILEMFHLALSFFHELFREKKGQNHFYTPGKLLILSDRNILTLSKGGKYYFI